ncbi:MAG TPA: PilZ domain-containing protein [Polyangiaceae bacterium]
MSQDHAERRRYRRLQVPVFCRAAGIITRRHPIDMSLGGVRIFSDQRFAKGERLTLEMMTEDALTPFTAEVVWIEELPPGSPATYDVGLRFHDVDPTQAAILEKILSQTE